MTKWPRFRRHLQRHFLEWKWLSFDLNFKEVFSQRSNWQFSSIGSDNCLMPNRRQAIILTNDVLACRRLYASYGINPIKKITYPVLPWYFNTFSYISRNFPPWDSSQKGVQYFLYIHYIVYTRHSILSYILTYLELGWHHKDYQLKPEIFRGMSLLSSGLLDMPSQHTSLRFNFAHKYCLLGQIWFILHQHFTIHCFIVQVFHHI